MTATLALMSDRHTASAGPNTVHGNTMGYRA